MILQAVSDKTGRDKGASLIIEYFDQPKFLLHPNPIEVVTAAELKALEEEWVKCRGDFRYIARNYFWITTKESGDILLNMNEAQDLVFETIRQLWATGRVAKLIILKARQLGMSTLIEAMVAWSTMMFPNMNGLVVSKDRDHAAYLFSMMLHIYDHLPWWLKPMIATRLYKDGLTFDNPDENLRRINPGLNSKIDVQAATDRSGIGQGRTLQAVHISELGDWPEHIAKETIEGDLKEAIAENNPRAFAVVESTAKGAGTFYDELWSHNIELSDRGIQEWNCIFIPAFFEKKRFIAPEAGWRPDPREIEIRERVKDEWTQCGECGNWKEARATSIDWSGMQCPFCHKGTLMPYVLSDGQLRYFFQKRINASRDPKSLAEFRQELPMTAVECFQSTGYNIFPIAVQEFVDRCVRAPILEGFIDQRGLFHAALIKRDPVTQKPVRVRCFQEHCRLNHEFDSKALKIWELPIPNRSYACGGDVSDGLGADSDFSVAFMNRIGTPGSPDVHVATYRSNEIDPISFAHVLVALGRWYNEALLSIESNFADTCANTVRIQYQYPNLFQWAHWDSQNLRSNKLHWQTNQSTKPRLWQTSLKWLRGEMWYVKSRNFSHELKKFQKEDSQDRGGGSAAGFKDDELMAGMIALYTAHHLDYDENIGSVGQKTGDDAGAMEYEMTCRKCKHSWFANDPNKELRCPGPDRSKPEGKCGNIMLIGKRINVNMGHTLQANFDDMAEVSVAPGDQGGYHQ